MYEGVNSVQHLVLVVTLIRHTSHTLPLYHITTFTTGLSSKAQGKHNIVRVRSNDPSDLSDDYTTSNNNNNTHASNTNSNASGSNGGGNAGGNVGNTKVSRRVRGAVQDSDGEENSGRHSGECCAKGLRVVHYALDVHYHVLQPPCVLRMGITN